MKKAEMTSMDRVLTTLSHKEADRVPMFLLLTMHGAKELGISIKEYFSKADYVIEGQILMQQKYSNDCYYPFFYAPIEVEAFGADVIYNEAGPPNSGIPFIQDFNQINKLQSPDIVKTKLLHKVLDTIKALNKYSDGKIPIIGVAISPFSLPVMQMGFDKYLELMYFQPGLFQKLMAINEEFCVNWSNAQLEAGATAICYFDPVSSISMIPRDIYIKTGYEIAKRTISRIKGPTATHFASGDCISMADLVPQTGTAVVGVSSKENLTELKAAYKNKLTLLGNLNGIEMRRWSVQETIDNVKSVIDQAATGGGFILSDNHGEIPYQVSEEVLMAISETVKEYGRFEG